MLETKKFYEVIAKCGHVGRKHYVPIKFAVEAESGKDAAKMVRQFPRVKHDHKDAIIKVDKIDYETFLEIIDMNNNDPYLQCHSRKEQNLIINLAERLEEDNHNKKTKYNKQERINKVIYKNKKAKILEKFSCEDSDYVYID